MRESVKQPLELKKRILSPKQLLQSKNQIGAWGETQAKKYLQQIGYKIIDFNVSCQQFEIDIVAIDIKNKELVFIEVKTRSSSHFGEISSSVNWKKLRSLSKMANYYQKLKKIDMDYRFDIVTIVMNKIRHHQNITWNYSPKFF